MKLGRTIKILMPNNEQRSAQYAIVDSDEIKASHNENTFAQTEGYPTDANGETINDRDYKSDIALQNAVIEYSANLQPERMISTSRTPSGTPIITQDGIVVSGNNRTMSLKRAINLHPEKYAAYKTYLTEEVSAFGLSEDDLQDIAHPVLVRIDYDFPAYNTLELSKYNKSTQKSEAPLDKAVKLGKQLAASDKCQSVISDVVGKYETFSDFYSNLSDQKLLLNTLLDCNILTKQETNAYFYERGFTEAGKDLIENLLAGLVLNKDSLIITNDAARKLRQIIITSLTVLSKNASLGKDSLIPFLNEAISIEGKIKASKLDFGSWINQLSIFDEDKPSFKALVINQVLELGRNLFKKAFEKYNESIANNVNENMFGDAPSSNEIFQHYFTDKLPENFKKIIDTFAQNSDKNKTEIVEVEPTENLFVSGNYFKKNPEFILANSTKFATSKWGNQVVVYEGTIDCLNKIDVPENLEVLMQDDNPLISVVYTKVTEQTDVATETIDNIEKAIAQSPIDVAKKSIRRSVAKNINPESEFDKPSSLIETYTLSEVYNLDGLNSQISLDELRAFLWFMNKKNRTVHNPEWYDLAQSTMDELISDTHVNEWIQKGVLFYYNGDLVPGYEYLSGNIYKKYMSLVQSEFSENVGADAAYIIDNYGQSVYENQVLELKKVFQRLYDQRLLISSDAETGLRLLPTSSFSKNFYINSFVDELPFKWQQYTAKGNRYYGMPALLKEEVSDYKKFTFEKLSLDWAFQLWLRTDKSIIYKQGMNYLDIIEYVFQNKPKPPTQAIKNADGNYSPDQKKILDLETAAYERTKSKAISESNRLFNIFLDKMLTLNDRVRLESEWNMRFNNNIKIDYNKIPVAFRMNKFINGQPLDVRPEKREAVAFTLAEGSGLLAYDVGVGKTPSAIFTVSAFIDFGYCQRPLIIVPNQTYKQWISEFSAFCGHLKINGLYNLSDKIVNEWTTEENKAQLMSEGSVTIMTYEGMKKLGFNQNTADQLRLSLMNILTQQKADFSDKQLQRDSERTNTIVAERLGKSLSKTVVNIEDFGFDYICFDEAHAAKKVFTNVAGEAEEHLGDSAKKTRAVSNYKIQSGTPSSTAIKAYTLCNYIQSNYNGNTQLLTATPFTNSPLEVYSMLSMIANNKLIEMGIENLNAFFDTFIEVSYELVINAKLNPERRQVILGYNNLLVLQQLIKRFINHKTGESVKVKRPNKIVLPLKNKMLDGLKVALPEAEQCDSILPLSDIQKKYMELIKQYAEGSISENQMCAGASLFEDEEDENAIIADGVELDEDALDSNEKNGVRLLKAMNHARNLSLSPYLFDCAGLGEPNYLSYIETSNKLLYTMECIRTIKAHHEKTNTPMSGVVIYMERGIAHFPLIREYLINEIGFEPHEVGIITAKTKIPAPSMPEEAKKEYIKNLFLGKKYNESTGDFDKLTDQQRMKVLIGSSTIKEGVNLQSYSSTLFNLFLPWNPTDVQQLEGRIYRQGNAFKNVRIVNPLMIDSIDIFMFQKLEEKTSRINSVWETDGITNVLKTEEFDPKDLKYSLIKDPKVIAQMELIEEKERQEENKTDIENKIKRIDNINNHILVVNAYELQYREWLEKYRPSDAKKPLDQALKSGKLLLKNQTDVNGLPMVYSWVRNFEFDDKGNKIIHSHENPASEPHYMDRLILANRQLTRFSLEFLMPTNRTIEDLPSIRIEAEHELQKIKEIIQELNSPEILRLKTEEIIEKRLEMNYKEKSLSEVVADFSKINHLLDDVESRAPNVIKVQCPVVDENGVPKIDMDSIRAMDECSKRQIQTRDLHAKRIETEDGQIVYEYTPERQALHESILKQMTANSVCITHEKPIAILMGGAPGSGKSSFLKKNAAYMTSNLIWKIDTDEVREFFPEYEGWNAGATHEEAAMLTNKLLKGYNTPCKHDVLYDGTMKNARKYIPIIKQLHEDGYLVFIAYMEIPKEISVQRAMNRYQKNNGGHKKYGRYVPLFVIDEFFQTGDELFQQIKKMVDGYIKVDSLTGNIIEKGGLEIPSNRAYFKAFQEPPIEKVESLNPPSINDAIDSLKILLKYSDKQSKAPILSAISSLEILKKYTSETEVIEKISDAFKKQEDIKVGVKPNYIKTLSLERLAQLIGGKLWIKNDLKRIYLDRGYNTKKMSTKTFIFQKQNGEFGVKCVIEVTNQPYSWIQSQQEMVEESVMAEINTILDEYGENLEVIPDDQIAEPSEQVQGYYVRWHEVRVPINRFGKLATRKRQKVHTFVGEIANAPKGFIALNQAEFEKAKAIEAKNFEYGEENKILERIKN